MQCFACGRLFTFVRLEIDEAVQAAHKSPCPHCSARPKLGPDLKEQHRLIDLREDTAKSN